MGMNVTTTDLGVPGLAGPDKQHAHLPFWYDLKVENAPSSPMEAWMQLGMMWMAFFAPVKDRAAECRDEIQRSCEFTARRVGLKSGLNFKLMPRGDHGLRFAFATLGGLKRFDAGMSRLQHDGMSTASNDPNKDAPLSSLSLLPNAFIPATGNAVSFTPINAGTIKTFPVKGLRAANNRHAQPKARVLAFKG